MAATTTAVTVDLDEEELELIVEAIGDYLPYAADQRDALAPHGDQWARRVDAGLRLKDRLGARIDELTIARGGDPR